jgi:hypothetical protein
VRVELNDPFGCLAASALGGHGQPFFAQIFRGFVEIAVGLLERFSTVEDTRPGGLA